MRKEHGTVSRSRLTIFVVLILLLLLIFFLIWWWLRPQPTTQGGVELPPPVSDTIVLPPQQPPVEPPLETQPTPVTPGEAAVESLARNFTERYGSWSTDSDYQNLRDLFPSITSRLQQTFQATISNAPVPEEFSGVQSRALQINIESLTDSRASVTVTAQRTVTKADLTSDVLYENLKISMIKQGSFWYVDEAEWL